MNTTGFRDQRTTILVVAALTLSLLAGALAYGSWAQGDPPAPEATAAKKKKKKKKKKKLVQGPQGPQGPAGPRGGTNPNADTLDGIDSTGFVRGNGRTVAVDFGIGQNNSGNLLPIPGIGTVSYNCLPTGVQFGYTNAVDSGSAQHVWMERFDGVANTYDANHEDVNQGASPTFLPAPTTATAELRMTLQIGGVSEMATVTLFGASGGAACRFTGQAQISYDANS